MYVHAYTGSYKKLWTSALLYILYTYIFLHIEQASHNKILSLSSGVPRLTLRKSHSRLTSYAKEQSSL